ncbi:epoxide hydrolase [Sphingobium sp. C100]|nr:epoxide hydrolase [Sphingobium sp. C100]
MNIDFVSSASPLLLCFGTKGEEIVMIDIDVISVRSGDVSLSVAVAGKGPLVIMMHGWPDLGRAWRHQMGPLADAGYRVAAPDMRGYGDSSAPEDPAAYTIDHAADDMSAIADALGYRTWISVGHDWGSPVAWRTAQRFPDRVRAVFSLGVPHRLPSPVGAHEWFDAVYPGRFYYMRYFEPVGPAEDELGRDARDSLKRIFHALSGEVPFGEWLKPRPLDDALLPGLASPPAGPLSFMSDAELDAHAAPFLRNGFYGSLCWYRNWDTNEAQARAYGDQTIRQPTGFLCGDREIVLLMFDHGLETQRTLCPDLRMERILSGCGHWTPSERPTETTTALLEFLSDVARRPGEGAS